MARRDGEASRESVPVATVSSPYHGVWRGRAVTCEFTMSIARAKTEQRDVSRADESILAKVAREFCSRFPRCEDHLTVYALRVSWGLYWSEIAARVKLDRSHCSRVFWQTKRRLDALREEKFAGVAPPRIYRDPEEDDPDDE